MDSMTIIDLIRQQVAAERGERFQRSDQLSLGSVIERLEKLDPEDRVVFDFCNMVPTRLESWRGSYDELALGFVDPSRRGSERVSVAELLERLRLAVGRTYTGWKGGEYVMGLITPVWVANPGDAHNTAIVGVELIDYQVVIQTAYMEF